MSWHVPGYSEQRPLGEGASGRVVLARHDGTGTLVAIKYLSDAVRGDPDVLARMRDEAALLAGIDSPHVARFYEYVETPDGAAIVMELINGVSLRELLDRAGATGPEAALVVLKGSLLGLAAAHRLGIVHRDYKPANVLIDPTGQSKLVDFGVAQRQGAAGDVSGTPRYMAPEQWNGAPAAPQTDIYAATATVLECVTGEPPFTAPDLVRLALAHENADVDLDRVPRALHQIVRRGMAKDPDRRPTDASALVAELDAVATAEYGDRWEERGRSDLAARVAVLAMLLPQGSPDAVGTTSVARTRLGRIARGRGTRVAGLGITAAVAGVLLVQGSGWPTDPNPRPGGPPPTTSATPTTTNAPAPPDITTAPDGKHYITKWIDGTKVTERYSGVLVDSVDATAGPCLAGAADVSAAAVISGDPATEFRYRWIRDDGAGPERTDRIDPSGSTPILDHWQDTAAGWTAVEILTPHPLTSQRAEFAVRCDAALPTPVTAGTATASPANWTGECGAKHTTRIGFSASISGPPGTAVTYRWVFHDGTSQPAAAGTLDAAGRLTVSTESWYTGPSNGWAALDVLTPTSSTSAQAPFTITCTAPPPTAVTHLSVAADAGEPGELFFVVVVNTTDPGTVTLWLSYADGGGEALSLSGLTSYKKTFTHRYPAGTTECGYTVGSTPTAATRDITGKKPCAA